MTDKPTSSDYCSYCEKTIPADQGCDMWRYNECLVSHRQNIRTEAWATYWQGAFVNIYGSSEEAERFCPADGEVVPLQRVPLIENRTKDKELITDAQTMTDLSQDRITLWNEVDRLKSALKRIMIDAGTYAEGPTDPEFSHFLALEEQARAALQPNQTKES